MKIIIIFLFIYIKTLQIQSILIVGWGNWFDDVKCFDENEETDYAFLYKTDSDTEALPYTGKFATYGGGGYHLDIGPKQSIAQTYVQIMKSNTWIDENTRAVFVETMLYNANSKLFSHVKIVFEFSTYGTIDMEYKISTANLYPYQVSFDYVVLGLQFVFVLIIFVKLVLIFVRALRSKCGYFLTLTAWIGILEVGFGTCAIVFFIIRVDETITAIEKIFKNLGEFLVLNRCRRIEYYLLKNIL